MHTEFVHTQYTKYIDLILLFECFAIDSSNDSVTGKQKNDRENEKLSIRSFKMGPYWWHNKSNNDGNFSVEEKFLAQNGKFSPQFGVFHIFFRFWLHRYGLPLIYIKYNSKMNTKTNSKVLVMIPVLVLVLVRVYYDAFNVQCSSFRCVLNIYYSLRNMWYFGGDIYSLIYFQINLTIWFTKNDSLTIDYFSISNELQSECRMIFSEYDEQTRGNNFKFRKQTKNSWSLPLLSLSREQVLEDNFQEGKHSNQKLMRILLQAKWGDYFPNFWQTSSLSAELPCEWNINSNLSFAFIEIIISALLVFWDRCSLKIKMSCTLLPHYSMSEWSRLRDWILEMSAFQFRGIWTLERIVHEDWSSWKILFRWMVFAHYNKIYSFTLLISCLGNIHSLIFIFQLYLTQRNRIIELYSVLFMKPI